MSEDRPKHHLSEDEPSELLSAADQSLLDALVEADFDPDQLGPLSAEQQLRAAALSRVFNLLEDYPVEDGDDTLVHATMARIDQYEANRAQRLRLPEQRDAEMASPRRRLWLPDFISVAAVLLIGVSVMWPVLANIRQRSIDAGCENNLRQMGYALSHYAGDYNGAVPTARAGLGSTWNNFHNMVNLRPLFDEGYCAQKHCQCPGHHPTGAIDDTGYSYQWQRPDQPIRLGTARQMTILLGDRNPVIDAYRAGQFVPPLTVSLNHASRGQFVLRTDGGTMWLEVPVVAKEDRIWVPGRAEKLLPDAEPVDEVDVFLAH